LLSEAHSLIDKLKQRFRLKHVVLVGDRGMMTPARITEEIRSAGLDWITALRDQEGISARDARANASCIGHLVAVYSALGYTTGPARCCR
jgi:hypothetical protein